MSVLEVPGRSVDQKLAALALANSVRYYRARVVKPGLADGTVGLFDAMDDPQCATMRVSELLKCIPFFGEVKVNGVLRATMIGATKTCGQLTDHQREWLAQTITSRHPYTPVVFRA